MSKLGELPPRSGFPKIKVGDVLDIEARTAHDFREFRAIATRTGLCERVVEPNTTALEQVACPLRVLRTPEKLLQLARSFEGLTLGIRPKA